MLSLRELQARFGAQIAAMGAPAPDGQAPQELVDVALEEAIVGDGLRDALDPKLRGR